LRVFELEFGAATAGAAAAAGPDQLDRIGPYELLEELRRGGMGRVFVARQIELGRIVALKAVAVGAGARPELELRFLREAQTIARLRHPHIVVVHDSGRADGCVYFSMDYIEGGDLAARLRGDPPGVAAGALLLRKLAGALEYAHGQGVLHRDLKPSNILLDGEEPLLADFGLAAELGAGGDLTQATSVLGTPHYLAPEAMRAGSAALSVASDIYALGVVLFELLTGRTPFAGATPAELPMLVADSDPPPPHLLAPAVPRDLETICLKCLERDPARRYATAGALAEDLRRFLAGERVLAQPPSARYRFEKFAARHRVALAAAAIVAAVLVAATVVSASLAVRASRAEKHASTEAASSREVTNFLQNDLLAQASPDEQPNRDLPLRTALDRAAGKIETRFRDQPLVAAALEGTLARTYVSLGEYATGQQHYERAIALRGGTAGRPDATTLGLMGGLAIALSDGGKYPEAEALIATTLAQLQQAAGPESPLTLHAMNDEVSIHQVSGRLPEAEALAIRTLALSRKVLGPDHVETRNAVANLASIYFTEEKLPEAERTNLEAVELQRRALGAENPATLSAMSNLASVYWDEGKLADAEKMNRQILEIQRRVLGPEHSDTLRSMHNLGTTLADEHRLPEATELEKATLELRRRTLGPEHLDTISSTNTLASDYLSAGRLAEAEALIVPELALSRRVLGADHYLTLNMAGRLAIIYDREHKLPEAEAAYRDTLAAYARLYGAASLHAVQLRDRLGVVLTAERRFAEAEPLLLEAYSEMAELAKTVSVSEGADAGRTVAHLVALYDAWGKPAAAASWKSRLP
jgi:tetratricopeptide (TPR) repeat protein